MDSTTNNLHKSIGKGNNILSGNGGKISCKQVKLSQTKYFFTILQKEVPGIISETKIVISNEESNRMGQANAVTQRLFSLIDTISNAKLAISHESCEAQRKKVVQDLSAAQQQIELLNQQWNEHICWSGQNQTKHAEETTRYILFCIKIHDLVIKIV